MITKFRFGIFLLMLAAILVSMTACTSKTVEVTAADDGGSVEVRKGSLILIKLPGNPSTGYTWEVTEMDENLLRSTKKPEFVSDDPNLVGSGGTVTLTFKALEPGTTTIQLIYHRTWEKDVEPLDVFTVTVIVN